MLIIYSNYTINKFYIYNIIITFFRYNFHQIYSSKIYNKRFKKSLFYKQKNKEKNQYFKLIKNLLNLLKNGERKKQLY